MNAEFAPLLKLGRAERLQLVENPGDSLVQDGHALPVSDEQRDELRRRKAHFSQHPQSGLSWAQVKAQARATSV